MKFSAIVATLLAVSPARLAQAGLLRSKEEETFKTSKAQIVIQGVPQDFSKHDLKVINKSAISAYNAVQKDSSYSLVTVKPLLHFGTGDAVSQCMMCPPDDDAFSLGEEKVVVADVQVRSKQCMMCPPDDDAVTLQDSSNHKLFVESFCNLLATSGSANLAKAHHCSFSFLEKPGHDVAPLSLVNRGETSEAALGFLSLTGLLHELSADDVAIVESSTFETFNQAFATMGGYSELKALHVRSAVETPKDHHGLNQCMMCPPDDDAAVKQCMMCPPDDDSFLSSRPAVKQCMMCPPDDDSFSSRAGFAASALLLDIEFAAPKNHKGVSQCMMCPPDDDAVKVPAVKQCMMCPPDDDSVKVPAVKQCMMCPPDDDAVAADFHTLVAAFSRALCTKLRNSGSPNLVFADDCALDFFYEHAVGEASA